jgi:pimeloyl-ACP methyl ester carboxylesterase
MRDRIPGAELVLIKDAGHSVMLENAKTFNGVLKGFVGSLPQIDFLLSY